MDPRDRVLSIVGEIYAAAGDPLQWDTCLASIRDLFDATAAHLVHHHHQTHDGGIYAAAGLDPATVQAYANHYHTTDPWARRVDLTAVGPGDVILGESLLSHAEMVKTEYYDGLGRANGLTRCMVAYLAAPSDAASVNLSLNRSDRASEFGVEDARLFSMLVPHLQRALAIHRRLTRIDAQRGAAADVIDRLTVGVILFDRTLRVVLVNDAAGRILRRRDGLVLDTTGLRTGDAELTSALIQMLGRAVNVAAGTLIDPGDGVLTVPRPSGGTPLRLLVTPVARHNEYAGVADRAAVAMFVDDPDRAIAPSPAILRQLFGLTPTEARVAIAIAEGQRVAEIAGALHLTRATARYYVKQVLAKTGTSTQAQLVRVVLCALGGLNFSQMGGVSPDPG